MKQEPTEVRHEPHGRNLRPSGRGGRQVNQHGLYLTGSASGRGWVSELMNPIEGKSYGDLDVIIVPRWGGPNFAERIVEDAFRAYRLDFTKEIVAHHNWVTGVIYTAVKYELGNGRRFELQVQPTLEESIADPLYWRNRLFVRLI